MENARGIAGRIYDNYRLIAVLPAICVILDYALTFSLAGDTSTIISWEASPLVRFAVINNLLIPYVVGIILFYYGASFFVLRILTGTVYYKFGVLLIATMSITHLFGGLSWYFRNAMYSNSVMGVSMLSIVMAFVIFGFSLIRGRTPVHP